MLPRIKNDEDVHLLNHCDGIQQKPDRLPGAYEIPLIADIELSKPAVGGLVVLGYIEKGETLHGEVMGHSVSNALVNLQLKLKKPIGIGIIGPGATYEQAEVRYENSARAAVRALKHVADLLGIQ